MKDSSPLRDFSIPALPHTGLFGVFLGTHAVSDALNLLHTGVGCKGKTQRQIVQHDLSQDAHTKVGWTELREEDLIRGGSEVFIQAAHELYRRRKPLVMLVTASTSVEFTGVDLPALARKLEAELRCPVSWIPHAAYQSDLYAGYTAVIQALLRKVPWERPYAEKPTVSLVGYFFHRHEMEQAANLAELRRLVEGLGAKLGPTFLGGESFAVLQQAHESRVLVRLPYAGIEAKELAALSGRKVVACDLPLGIQGTSAWMREVGKALGLEPKQVENRISREVAKAAPRLRLARRRLNGKRIAIVADTPLAAAWASLAGELGLAPVLVVLIDRSLGGENEFSRLIEAAGGKLADTHLVCDPTLTELRELIAAEHSIDIAVRPEMGLAESGWDDIPTVECGFPATNKHFIYPLPELGYSGAVSLAQRLMDAAANTH